MSDDLIRRKAVIEENVDKVRVSSAEKVAETWNRRWDDETD